MQERRAFFKVSSALLAAAGMAGLAGCGFRLRGAPQLAFKSIYLNVSPNSAIGTDLARALTSSSTVVLITDSRRMNEAEVILDGLGEQREKAVVGVTSSGQVREFQLRLRFSFRLRTPQGRELLPATELLQQREVSFNESAALAKETEEGLLYRDMQSDIVQQALRRLAAVRSLDGSVPLPAPAGTRQQR